MNAVMIARVAHETNRAYCEVAGLDPHKSWEASDQAQRASVISGVQSLIDDPSLSAEEMHKIWMGRKIADGWTFGETRSERDKTHPNLVDWRYMPPHEQVKDHLFVAVVRVLAGLPPGYVHV